jgi:glutaredoxin
MEKNLAVFTMEGCPYCVDFKKMLKDNNIEFTELDINEHQEEYEMFVEITKNEYVPAFMIIEGGGESVEFFAPERDYEELDQALEIIRKKVQ